MRLIDVDEAIKQFDPNTWQGEMLITILKGLPTAYDVDGVADDLENLKRPYIVLDEEKGLLANLDYYVEKAIEIVRKGGKS